MKLTKMACAVALAMLMLLNGALAGEIGELVTPAPTATPAPAADEIGEMTTDMRSTDIETVEVEDNKTAEQKPVENNTTGEIGEVLIAADEDVLQYEVVGGVVDAEGNWLYALGKIVSWENLPENSRVAVCLRITNPAQQAVQVQVTETVDGVAYDRGSMTVEAGSRCSIWRYYAQAQEIVRTVAYTVNGEEVAAGEIAFTLTGAPETIEVQLSACEMDATGAWVRDLGDTAHRAQIDIGQHWGYAVHVKNTGAQETAVRVYDSLNGDLYDWGEVTVAAGADVVLPVKLRGTVQGERNVYVVVNGEKIAEKTIEFVQD